MTKLLWDQSGDRIYETGVDRGVLYPLNVDGVSWNGVVWNGLTAVEENPSGGDATPYYFDGVKYLNTLASEEFEATINAYTYPDEFYELDGTSFGGPGLGLSQQPRKVFGLSYRTKIGNDVNGQNYGYKIHLIYNALASPSSRSNLSVGDSPEAISFSWKLTTTPVDVIGMRPLSHLIIDSTKMNPDLVVAVEDILYGTPGIEPNLPTPDELVILFASIPTLQVTDNGDGTFTLYGPDNIFNFPSSTEFEVSWPSALYINAESYNISTF